MIDSLENTIIDKGFQNSENKDFVSDVYDFNEKSFIFN